MSAVISCSRLRIVILIGVMFCPVAMFAAPPKGASDFKIVGNEAYRVIAGCGKLRSHELSKLREAIDDTEVSASMDPLPLVDGEKVIVDGTEGTSGRIALQFDRKGFDESLRKGTAFRVVSQAYLQVADLSPGLVDERATNGRTIDGLLKEANTRYVQLVIQNNIQVNVYPNGQGPQQNTPAVSRPAVHSPRQMSPAEEAEDREVQRVLDSSARTLANRLPPYVPRERRPDYEGMTKDLVAPYQAAAEVVRAQGAVKRARAESQCICHATCLFYKGLQGPNAREYDFDVGPEEDSRRSGCRAKMFRACRFNGGVGQGVWGHKLENEDYTPGCDT